MPKIVQVTPKNGARVLDPVTCKPIPENGVPVELSTYWKRRELDGEVTITEPPADNAKVDEATTTEPPAEESSAKVGKGKKE